MNQIQIGRFIAASRKARNLTQRQLADKLGISDKTVSKWECPYTAAVILWNPVRAAPRKLPPVLTFADVPPIMFLVQSMEKEGHTP